VPLYLAFINEHSHRSGCESFGRGADGKKGLLVDGCGVANFANPIPFCKYHLIVFDDGNCNTRNFPIFKRLVYIIIKIPGRRFLRPRKLTGCQYQQDKKNKTKSSV